MPTHDEELSEAVQDKVLQQRPLPPRDKGLRGADRRSVGDWKRRGLDIQIPTRREC